MSRSFFSKFPKRKLSYQTVLYIVAGILTLAVASFVLFLSMFIVSNVNHALSVNVNAAGSALFDIEGFEKLHLVNE